MRRYRWLAFWSSLLVLEGVGIWLVPSAPAASSAQATPVAAPPQTRSTCYVHTRGGWLPCSDYPMMRSA